MHREPFRVLNRLNRHALFGIEGRPCGRGRYVGVLVIDGRNLPLRYPLLIDERAFDVAPSRYCPCRLRARQRTGTGKRRQRCSLARCFLLERLQLNGQALRRQLIADLELVDGTALSKEARQRRGDAFADRVMVVVADELDEPEVILLQERLIVDEPFGAAEFGGRQCALASDVEHHAGLPTPAERDRDA